MITTSGDGSRPEAAGSGEIYGTCCADGVLPASGWFLGNSGGCHGVPASMVRPGWPELSIAYNPPSETMVWQRETISVLSG